MHAKFDPQHQKKRKKTSARALWHMPEIPAFRGLKQENLWIEASLVYIVRPYLKKQTS
jgi:hypothetical protein